MKNLLRILVLLIIVVAVVGVSMFLMDQNTNYNQNDSVPPVSQGEEIVNTEILEPVSGESNLLESGDVVIPESGEVVEISGDLNEEVLESGDAAEVKEDEIIESGEVLESTEILESGEMASGELAA